MENAFCWTMGTSVFVRSLFLIRCSVNGFASLYFPPTSSCMRNWWTPRTRNGVPSAARSLRPALTASNTARSAANGSPADKPPSVWKKCVPCYAIGAQKALCSAVLTAVFPSGKDLISFPSKMAFYCVTLPDCTHRKPGRGSQWLATAPRSFCMFIGLRLNL